MNDVGDDYENTLRPYIPPNGEILIPVYSTVTGKRVTSGPFFGPEYWSKNLKCPVRFDEAVRALLGDAKTNPVMIEIGPHAALHGPLRQILQKFSNGKSVLNYAAAVSRNQDSMKSIRDVLGQLYTSGYAVDFSAINRPAPILTDLPLYPWDHSKEYWEESRLSREYRARKHPYHELLGINESAQGGGPKQWCWRNKLSSLNVPWLKDHAIQDDVVFPAAAYLSTIGEAIRQVTGSEAYVIRNFFVKSAMMFRGSESTEVATTMTRISLTEDTESSWFSFIVASYNGESWTTHCVAEGKPMNNKNDMANHRGLAKSLPRHVSEEYMYNRMERMGLNFGPKFRLLQNISNGVGDYKARAVVADAEGEQNIGYATNPAKDDHYAVHPTVLDAILQLSIIAMNKGLPRKMNELQVPSRISHIEDLCQQYFPPPYSALSSKANFKPVSQFLFILLAVALA